MQLKISSEAIYKFIGKTLLDSIHPGYENSTVSWQNQLTDSQGPDAGVCECPCHTARGREGPEKRSVGIFPSGSSREEVKRRQLLWRSEEPWAWLLAWVRQRDGVPDPPPEKIRLPPLSSVLCHLQLSALVLPTLFGMRVSSFSALEKTPLWSPSSNQ